MKAVYLIWPDFDYIDRFIEAGIDTLIVAFSSIDGFPDDPTGYFDPWAKSVSILEKYKNSGVRLIACPSAYPSWFLVPKGSRFVSGGVEYPGHYCPTDASYIEQQTAPFRHLVNIRLCHEVIWDVEHYTGKPEMYVDQIRCECSRCLTFSQESQWKQRAILMSKDTFSTGQLNYHSWWSLNCYSEKKMLTERTYEESGIGERFNMWNIKRKAKKHGCNMKIIPGAFPELFRSTDKFLEYLKYLKSHCPYEGYWIYTQKMFSKNSRMAQSEIDAIARGNKGFYETRLIDDIDPGFFGKLKVLNG